jgi:fructose-1,6-bisphosphatase/inositol monophosphatase family enzyme
MTKALRRFVTLLLLSCFVVDPVTSAGLMAAAHPFPSSVSPHVPLTTSRPIFDQEALTLSALASLHSFMQHRAAWLRRVFDPLNLQSPLREQFRWHVPSAIILPGAFLAAFAAAGQTGWGITALAAIVGAAGVEWYLPQAVQDPGHLRKYTPAQLAQLYGPIRRFGYWTLSWFLGAYEMQRALSHLTTTPDPGSLAVMLSISALAGYLAGVLSHAIYNPFAAIPASTDHKSFDRQADFLLGFIENNVKPYFNDLFAGGVAAARARILESSEGKTDATPVTGHDRAIERQFRQAVAEQFPPTQYGVLAEEYKGEDWNIVGDKMFTQDPIDGTADLLKVGMPNGGTHFGTLEAYYEDGRPKVAVGYWPRLDVDGSGSSLLVARDDQESVLLNGRVVHANTAAMDASKTVIIGAHPADSRAQQMCKVLEAFFKREGYKVKKSYAGGGEVADMALRGKSCLYIHLTPAGVDAPTHAFLAQKMGLQVSHHDGHPIFPFPFRNLNQKLFFDPLVIGTETSHALALRAFREMGKIEEPLNWTDAERSMDPMTAVIHFNQSIATGKNQVTVSGDRELEQFKRKKESKKKDLRKQMAEAVARMAEVISVQAENDLQVLAREKTFQRAVLDPEKGALKKVTAIFREKRRHGQSTLVGEGGPPGAGKTLGGKALAEAVARSLEKHGISRVRIPILKEDHFLLQRDPVNRRGKDLEGKFRWDERDQVTRDLGEGFSVLKSMFDDVSGGNLLFSLNTDGDVVVHNGNRTVTIEHQKGSRTFSYTEVLQRKGEDPQDLTARRSQPHINISDSGLFVCGSTKMRMRIDEQGQLVVGIQATEIVELVNGEMVLVDQLTDHVINRDAAGRVRVGVLIPVGVKMKDSMRAKAAFELETVRNPLDPAEMRKAKEAKELIVAGSPIVYDGQFAFIGQKDERFVRDQSQYNVPLNYRAFRVVRWVRDMIRNLERGRTAAQVEDNARRFWDRAFTEEQLSVPAGISPEDIPPEERIIQVNTLDRAEAMLRRIYYGEEVFPENATKFEQMGVDPETIEQEQRRHIDEPVILELLRDQKDTLKLVRTIDGIDEYQIGSFLLRVAQGTTSLTPEQCAKNEELRQRTNRVMGGNSLVNLASLGPIFPGGRSFGYVSLWNQGPLVGQRLEQLASQGEAGRAEGEKWIERFIEQELKLYRRGIVDANPDLLLHRRLLPIGGEIEVAVVSPEDNLKTGKEALELYREAYLPRPDRPIIYLRPDLVSRIPEPFRNYYVKRVSQSLGLSNELAGFYTNEFERTLTLPTVKHTPKEALPEDLRPYYKPRVSLVLQLNSLRNWCVEHPAIFAARLDHIRALYTRYFLRQARKFHFEGVHTTHGSPSLAWTALVVHAYPDRYAPFYRLVSLFYEEVIDNPDLLQEPENRMNRAIRQIIENRYRTPYEQTGIEAPRIGESTWQSFNEFLNEARALPTRWGEKFGEDVRDETEYQRLMEEMGKEKCTVLVDWDGTISLIDNATMKPLPGFLKIQQANIGMLARLASHGILVVVVTNRRKTTSVDFAKQIVSHPAYRPGINPVTGGSFVEVYWGSGIGGMDAGTGQEFDDFKLEIPESQMETIVLEVQRKGLLILPHGKVVPEKLGGKINLRTPPGTDQTDFIADVSEVLHAFGYLEQGSYVASAKSPDIPVKVLAAGDGVVSIIPAATDKERVREYVKARHHLSDEHLRVLVDQPQPGGADEGIIRNGGITVGEQNPDIPGLISTVKATGQKGPAASSQVLRNSNWVPLAELTQRNQEEEPHGANSEIIRQGMNGVLRRLGLSEVDPFSYRVNWAWLSEGMLSLVVGAVMYGITGNPWYLVGGTAGTLLLIHPMDFLLNAPIGKVIGNTFVAGMVLGISGIPLSRHGLTPDALLHSAFLFFLVHFLTNWTLHLLRLLLRNSFGMGSLAPIYSKYRTAFSA